MHNLFSVLLARTVEHWLSCDDAIPYIMLESMERWLRATKTHVAVQSQRREEGVMCTGLTDDESCLRPRTLHVGVLEEHVYQLLFERSWRRRFAERENIAANLNFAVDYRVPTRTSFRRIFNVLKDVDGRHVSITKTLFSSNEKSVETIQEAADIVEPKRSQRRDGRTIMHRSEPPRAHYLLRG